MSTVLDEETTTVVLEGLDFQERCGVQRGGEHRADVLIRFRCCGADGLLCLPHMKNQRDNLLMLLALGCRVLCWYCEKDVTSWDDLVEVVPL